MAVGRTRHALAALLEQQIAGARFVADDLFTNPSRYPRGQASWNGHGRDAQGHMRSVCSFDSMRSCVLAGDRLSVTTDFNGYAYWEVHAERRT